MNASIKSIEYYLPETIVNNHQLEQEFSGWNALKIEKKVGIRERHVVKEDETALDLAVQAAEKVFENYDRKTIDFVIFCTQSPDYFLPPNACILQDKLGLRTDIGAFDYNLACSGYIYGLAVSKGLIAAGIAHHILLITSETYSKYIHPMDQSNRTIFGDGASATIIESSEENTLLEFSLGTAGKGYDKLIVPCGGLRKRYVPNAEVHEDPPGSFRTCNDLYMNGPEIFNFTIEAVPKVVNDVLLKNGLDIKEIDYVIFHQANQYILDYLRKKIKIPKEKFYLNLLYTGNTVSATIPIALKDCLSNNLVKKNDRILLVGFGVGYSWGGVIIEI
jgi:3-oxoacyl-[acyl-carrier-protein] synthase-3